MTDEITDFIWSNYSGIEKSATKEQLRVFVERYRHRVIVVRSKKDESLIGVTIFLIQDTSLHILIATQTPELQTKDSLKILKKIAEVAGCNKIYTYRDGKKPKVHTLWE